MSDGQISAKIECSKCNSLLDGFTHLTEEDAKPSDGDISVCAYCGNIGKYTNGVTMLQTLDEDELNKVMLESPEAYVHIQKIVDFVNKRNNKDI